MRKILLGGLVVAGITLAGCAQVGDALSSVLGIFKVAFSLDDQQPLSYSLEYPTAFQKNSESIATALKLISAGRQASLIDDLTGAISTDPKTTLLNYAGLDASNPIQSLLSQTKLNLTFNVNADNSGNKHKAAFPFSTGLGLFVKNLNSSPTTTGTLNAFEVPASGSTALKIPVQVPFTALQTANVSDDVIKGTPIPYKINGNFKFALVPTAGDTIGKDSTTMDLVASNISTRPTSSSDASLLSTFTSLLNFLSKN